MEPGRKVLLDGGLDSDLMFGSKVEVDRRVVLEDNLLSRSVQTCARSGRGRSVGGEGSEGGLEEEGGGRSER